MQKRNAEIQTIETMEKTTVLLSSVMVDAHGVLFNRFFLCLMGSATKNNDR